MKVERKREKQKSKSWLRKRSRLVTCICGILRHSAAIRIQFPLTFMATDSPSNSLGLTGLPPPRSSPLAGESTLPQPEVPSVNVEAPSNITGAAAVERGRIPLESSGWYIPMEPLCISLSLQTSASEPDNLGAHSTHYTYPGPRTHSARSSPGPSTERRRTESNSPPHRKRGLGSPKLSGNSPWAAKERDWPWIIRHLRIIRKDQATSSQNSSQWPWTHNNASRRI